MLRSKAFVRKTRRGKVMKVVREHYLRNDIWCGCPTCKVCQQVGTDGQSTTVLSDGQQADGSLGSGTGYVVIDTNIALHQMDLLEDTAVRDIVVPVVVRDEVKHRNTAAYNRLQALCADKERGFYVFANEFHAETYVEAAAGETPNDRNDRAIRATAMWYKKHLPHISIVLLTDDRLNLKAAEEDGLVAHTSLQWATNRTEHPQLVDLVARGGELEEEENDAGSGRSGRQGGRVVKRTAIYKDHLSNAELQKGMREGRLHQGTLVANRFRPGSASVMCDSFSEDHLDMNRAMDSDRVVVELLPEEQWTGSDAALLPDSGDMGEGDVGLAPAPAEEGRGVGVSSARRPTGRVVGIIKRSYHLYTGSLDPKSARGGRSATSTVLFVAHDKRAPRVRLRTRQLDTLAMCRIAVVVDSWSVHSRWPDGHYVRTLGNTGDKAAETEVLLIENDINTAPFTDDVYRCVPPLPWDSAAAEIGKDDRVDLREELIFSVDPPGCRDIDDALHVKPLPNGNYEVGVHIADVTHFVKPGSAVDVEAANRCTSVYLVDRRIDMLPKALTEDICSLRADVERLTFSVIWEMDSDANIINTKFHKSVIKSSAAMTYQEAQTRMDDSRLTDDTTLACRHMNALAKVLRRRRIERGALTLASAEVKFKIDTETHDPMDVGMYQVREANQMVEEMMLLANVAVAEKILQHFPQWSLLRRHQTPSPEMYEPLLQAVATKGIIMDVTNSKTLADSLDRAVLADDPFFNKMVRILATRCMTQAQYFCTGEYAPAEFVHYGLAAPLYTHFTSPIRRYADVVVHRFLAAAIGIANLPQALMDRPAVKEVSEVINYRHRNAQMAGRASVELYTLVFFADRTAETDARVVKVKESSIVVFVPKYGIEGIVWLAAKGDTSSFTLDLAKQRVAAVDGSAAYAMFDTVWVRISVEDQPPVGRKLVLKLLDGPPKEGTVPEVDSVDVVVDTPGVPR